MSLLFVSYLLLKHDFTVACLYCLFLIYYFSVFQSGDVQSVDVRGAPLPVTSTSKLSPTVFSLDFQNSGKCLQLKDGPIWQKNDEENDMVSFQEWMSKKQMKRSGERTVFKNISNCSIVNVVLNGGDSQSVSSVLENVRKNFIEEGRES